MGEVARLNWGCGGWVPPGWINADRKGEPGVNLVCDIRDGLPIESNSLDYAVSIHALPEVPFDDVIPVLLELHRVLKKGGTLRLGLPDLAKGFRAYEQGDATYFLIPDEDALSIGAKLITQLVWYGYTRTLFVPGFVEELLLKAHFQQVHHCHYRQTASGYPKIVELDNRERESLFVEGVK